MKKKLTLLTVTTLSVVALAACSTSMSKSDSEQQSSNTEKIPASSTIKASNSAGTSEKEKQSFLELFNKLASHSVSTEELYVTGDITVSDDGEVKPGIYDLHITGGFGNITGDRSDTALPFINWVGASPDSSSTDYVSVIRMILLKGDKLEFSNISKVKFTAVPKDVTMTNELGTGNYIVGRDIKPGTYKLSTNTEMDSQFENLGWNISILNLETGKKQDQTLNPGNSDVAVKLKEGEIVTTSFTNTSRSELPADQIRLIFTEINQ